MVRIGLPLFRTVLVERSAYKEIFLTGEPPTRSQTGKAAGAEIQALLTEILAVGEGAKVELEMAG